MADDEALQPNRPPRRRDRPVGGDDDRDRRRRNQPVERPRDVAARPAREGDRYRRPPRDTESDHDRDRSRRNRSRVRPGDALAHTARRRSRSSVRPTGSEEDDDRAQPNRPRARRPARDDEEDEEEPSRRARRDSRNDRPRRVQRPEQSPDSSTDPEDAPQPRRPRGNARAESFQDDQFTERPASLAESDEPDPESPVESEDDQHNPSPGLVENYNNEESLPQPIRVSNDINTGLGDLAEAPAPQNSSPGLVRRLTRHLTGRSRRGRSGDDEALRRAMRESQRAAREAPADRTEEQNNAALQRALAESEQYAQLAQQRRTEDDTRALREAIEASARADEARRRREEEVSRKEEEMLAAIARESMEAEERAGAARRARLEEQRRLLAEYGGDVEGGQILVTGTPVGNNIPARTPSGRPPRASAGRPEQRERRRADPIARLPDSSRGASTASATPRQPQNESQRREPPSLTPITTSTGPVTTASTRAAEAHHPRASSGLRSPPITAADVGVAKSPRLPNSSTRETLDNARRQPSRGDSTSGDRTRTTPQAPRPESERVSRPGSGSSSSDPRRRRDATGSESPSAPAISRSHSSRLQRDRTRPETLSRDEHTCESRRARPANPPEYEAEDSQHNRPSRSQSQRTPTCSQSERTPSASTLPPPSDPIHRSPSPDFDEALAQAERESRMQALVATLSQYDEDSEQYIAALAALDRATLAEQDIVDTGLDDVDRAPSYDDIWGDKVLDPRKWTSDNWWKNGSGKKQEIAGRPKRINEEIRSLMVRGLAELKEREKQNPPPRFAPKPIAATTEAGLETQRELQADMERVAREEAAAVTTEQEAGESDVMADLTRGDVARTLMAQARRGAPGNSVLDVGDQERENMENERRTVNARLNGTIARQSSEGGRRQRR